MVEIWKDIKGYEGLYQVSNLGRVKSLARFRVGRRDDGRLFPVKERIMKLNTSSDYNRIQLFKDGVGVVYSVHKLQLAAFIPNPENLPCGNHKDENKKNNYIHVNEDGTVDPDKSNLEWCTIKYNTNYGTGIERARQKHRNNKNQSKPVLQFSKKGDFICEYPSTHEAERQTNILHTAIMKCCNGKPHYLTAGGFIWKYKDAS